MRLPRSSKYWSEADGRAVIEAWRRSGESRSAFARRHGLQTKRLKYWAGRLSRTDGPARTLTLVPATVVGAGLSAVIRAGEVTIELSSATPEQVAAIAQVLARSTS
jgi:transposase-like protein